MDEIDQQIIRLMDQARALATDEEYVDFLRRVIKEAELREWICDAEEG